MTSQPLLQVRELSKYFPVTRGAVLTHKVGDIKAVDRVSFDLYAGETLGLVGESGCGKTTTGRVILKLIEPSSGQILYNGHDITHLDKQAMAPLRREMQIIFQDPYASLNPRHPYTQALLSAVPSLKQRKQRRRLVLSGDVPTPFNPPQGCRFHTRCPMAMDTCRSVEPTWRDTGDGHFVACHLYA